MIKPMRSVRTLPPDLQTDLVEIERWARDLEEKLRPARERAASRYAQAYVTASKTHSNPTATVLTDSTGATVNDDIIRVNEAITGVDGTGNNAASVSQLNVRLTGINENFADLTDRVNKLIADVANVKQVLNAVIDDLQRAEIVR